MTKIKIAIILFLLIAFAGVSAANAQDSKPAPSPSDALSALKSKLLEVKHRDPRSLLDVLKLLGSPAGSISANSDFHTITVRDLPENIALIEDAIRRLDTPEPARPDMEFRIHVLIASSAPSGQEELPADLRDVVKQLQETLRYKSYAVMASAIHRTKEGGQGVYNKGVAESKLFSINSQGNPIFYDYSIRPINLEASPSGARMIQIGNFTFNMRVPVNVGTQTTYEPSGFSTPVTVRDGEKVVVGTTTMGDKGLVIVLIASVSK